MGEIDEAEKLAEQANIADGYNAAAYVNLGNCSFSKEEYEKARDLYNLALENDSSCTEALYNLGINLHTILFNPLATVINLVYIDVSMLFILMAMNSSFIAISFACYMLSHFQCMIYTLFFFKQ